MKSIARLAVERVAQLDADTLDDALETLLYDGISPILPPWIVARWQPEVQASLQVPTDAQLYPL